MIKCNWCSREEPYFEIRQHENTGKWKIWDENLGIFHSCKENKIEQREKLEYKWNKVKFKVPIFCFHCNKSVPALNPCSHILADGFIVGKDTSEFYANTKAAEENRELVKSKLKIKNEVNHNPQQKLF